MKKLLIFIFSFALWQTTQAQTNVDSLLCKSWKIDFPQTYALMSATAKQSFDNLPAVQRQKMQENLVNQRFGFGMNGALQLQYTENGNTETTLGTWVWVTTGTKFSMSFEGLTLTKQVLSLQTHALVLDAEGTATQTGMFDKWHLIPANE